MSVLEIFKNIPRSPYGGATRLKCKKKFQICNEVPGVKKRGGPVALPSGDRWAQPTGAAGGPVAPPRRRQGGLSPPPSGDRGRPPYIRIHPPFPPHLSPKIPPKIQKKKEGRGEGKRRSPAGLRTCDLKVNTFSLCIFPLVL